MAQNSTYEGSSGPKGFAKAAAAGAAAGALTHATIGGVGVAAAGTAVGVTMAPFIAIGAGVASIGYGLFLLGRRSAGK